MLQLVEDEARHDERATDEAALHDVGDAAVDDHRGIEERALLADAVALAVADVARERAELGAFDRARGRTPHPQQRRADDRREAT